MAIFDAIFPFLINHRRFAAYRKRRTGEQLEIAGSKISQNASTYLMTRVMLVARERRVSAYYRRLAIETLAYYRAAADVARRLYFRNY